MIKHGESAKKLFMEGYNCSQAVLCAFEDLTGLDHETSAKIASSFGGGMGRMREVCGAFSGMLMVLGLVRGYEDPGDPEAKKTHYHLVQEAAAEFRKENGSIICRELLKGCKTVPGKDPEARTEEYYKKRPCPEIVRTAAEITERLLGL